jgi:hypothetical protein
MRWIIAVACLFASVGAALMGQGGAPVIKALPLTPLPTPQDALRAGLSGLAAGDEARALATIRTSSDDQRDLLRAQIEYNQAVLKFREKFIAKYGPDAWKKFQGLSQEPAKEKGKETAKEVTIPLEPIDQKAVNEKVSKAIIELRFREKEREPFEAHARFPRENKPTLLVKVDGGWVMAFDNFGNVQGKLANQIKSLTLRRETELLNEFQKAIGANYPGTSKEIKAPDIAFELGRALVVEHTGLEVDQKYHRFDIDKVK